MRVVDIHEAAADLERLVERAAAGEGFVIARAGRPIARVLPMEAGGARRLGFLAGEIAVPDDFDSMGAEDLRRRFGVPA